MRYPDSLRSQRGSSIVEFLICAPIVALLTYVTYDLNRRIENQQTVTIASRNAVLLGDAFSQDRLESNARAQLAVQGQIMDQAEKSLVLRSNNSANGSGLFLKIEKDKKIGDADFAQKSRLDASTEINTVGANGGSTFDTMSKATGKVAQFSGLVSGVQATGETLRIFIPDGIRTAGVETRATGDTNAIQGAIGLLTQLSTGRPEAGREVLDVERRFAQRSYFRQESGYHPNGFSDFALAGIAVGRTKSAWGENGDFSDSNSSIQARCMTRLYGSDECGSGGSHDFWKEVVTVAALKMAISGALWALKKIPFTAAAATVADTAIQTAVSTALDAVKSVITEKVVDAVTHGIADKAVDGFKTQLDGPLKSLTTVSDGFAQDMDPNNFNKVIGGQ